MQPRRPQGQRAPPWRITTWPISPAASRPIHGLPSRMMPPPTPVPQKTPSTDLYWRAAPSAYSASVATCTSLPSRTFAPSSFSSAAARSKRPSQPGRFFAPVTVPAASSTLPGEPMPTPLSFFVATPACSAASASVAPTSAATSSGPPVVGVGRRALPAG